MQQHPDPLSSFSHRIVQFKFIVLELAMLCVFLTWVWDKLKHDIWTAHPPQGQCVSFPVQQKAESP